MNSELFFISLFSDTFWAVQATLFVELVNWKDAKGFVEVY
jgi:hypothetical protein